MGTSIVERVIEQLRGLPEDLQWRVLEFVRALTGSAPRGVPGEQLLRLASTISPEDARLMSEAIERGCEQVDVDEW